MIHIDVLQRFTSLVSQRDLLNVSRLAYDLKIDLPTQTLSITLKCSYLATMAARHLEPSVGHKRGPDESPSTNAPVAKKLKQSALVQQPAVQSPYISAPPPDRRLTRLPHLVSDTKPLSTSLTIQSLELPNTEYQSIAASAVLQASLTRSQARWTCEGIFERYWTKPGTGKNAQPPPPNNPDVKWMKSKGECRIRAEPHVFDCQMYLE